MESQNEENVLREIPDLSTLHELLARLNETQEFNPITRTEQITVEDIAETLDLDPEYVAQQLEDILEEHRQARISGVLRELEEPLYRVERTGHTPPDPLGNPLFKLRSVQLLVERSKLRPVLPRRKTEEASTDQIGSIVAKIMMIIVFTLIAITLISAFVQLASR
jgi:hypothetical protein